MVAWPSGVLGVPGCSGREATAGYCAEYYTPLTVYRPSCSSSTSGKRVIASLLLLLPGVRKRTHRLVITLSPEVRKRTHRLFMSLIP